MTRQVDRTKPLIPFDAAYRVAALRLEKLREGRAVLFFDDGVLRVEYSSNKAAFDKTLEDRASACVGVYDYSFDSRALKDDLKTFYAGVS